MPSFDVVSKINIAELKNAIDNANREILNRFDLKGTTANLKLQELEVIMCADDDFKIKQVYDILPMDRPSYI